jgi:GNAT superfamily N-acetyltransferase
VTENSLRQAAADSRPKVEPLRAIEFPAAASLAAAAFCDDPYWLALGPRRPGLRRPLIAAETRRQLRHATRAGDALLAIHAGGGLAAIARVADECRHRPPRVPPPAIAACGPVGAARWRSFEAQLASLLPSYRHHYLYTLAVAPVWQRTGLGRTLLTEIIDRAVACRRPLLLDTMTRQNVLWYRRFGFAEIADLALPRRHHAWIMEWRATAQD